MTPVENFFREQFGTAPAHVLEAPGRLELLGNHTDYNEGLVMAIAVDRYIHMAAAPRQDGYIELASTAYAPHEKFPCNVLEKNPAAPWANYIKGVLKMLKQRGVHFTGFNAAVHGTIPVGAGMSSSAALEVATALIVRQLFPFTLTTTGLAEPPQRDRRGALPRMSAEEKLILAKICQTAESQFVGVNCGLLDQISSLFGKASQVIQIDCQTNKVTHDPMPAGVAVVVCDSGIKHDLSAGDYNEVRRECEAAARALGVKALRAIDPPMLEAHKSKLTPR
ncbi:MAG: galactokinase family protein, partial [Verrucomicrobiota bacterium]